MRAGKLLLVLITMAASAWAQSPETAKVEKGFRPLFNGEDLTGWYGHNPHKTAKKEGDERLAAVVGQQEEFRAHWSVKEGALVNDGEGPYATTEKIYGDIEFRLDYRTVAKADSGIYLRGTPQVQIWDTTEEGGKWKIGADKGSGGLWNNSAGQPGKDPLVLADRAFGEWNEVAVRQLGSRTWVWLNQKLVVDGAIWENFWDKTRTTPLPARGPIHLQTHGGEISWRHLRIREFKADEANDLLRARADAEGGYEKIFNGTDLTGWTGAVENYEVVDGVIRCKKGKGGTLHTIKEYTDFAVRLEFLVPEGGNNGLAIRYPGKGNPAYDGMCELQVLDNRAEKYARLDERQYHGSAYGMVAAHRGYLRPAGQWNFQEVTVVGSTIRVELNGTVILDADLAKKRRFMDGKAHPGKDLAQGAFGFAGHNDPVSFRRVAIREL